MSDKKAVPTKENLIWKINYLAAQAGEKTHIKTAVMAASRAKYQKIHNSEGAKLNPEAIKQELYNARKQKLEHKLHQARRDIKQALKKAKQAETQKQIKKIKTTQKSLESNEEVKKKPTQQDLDQYEKELDTIKNINLDLLVDKTIKNRLEKNPELKTEELIKELVQSLTPTKIEDQTTQNIGSRLMAHKLVIAEINQIIVAFQHIIKGNNEKIEKQKAEEEKKKKAEEKKRKKEEEKKANTKKPRISSSSEFMETLGGGSATPADDENEDENFKAIYEGVKKPNRVGQRQRRKQWEEMYGNKANHIVKEYEKREEKRLQNPDYRPKKKPAPPKLQKHQLPGAPKEPVHPSWEAKKLQEEIMSKALSGKGGPSNNKIVFDDSD